MKRSIIGVGAICLLALSVIAQAAVQIEEGDPIRFKMRLAGEPPIDCSDESGYFWVPKDSLGITFAQAVKGLDNVVPKVARIVGPCGDHGFDGRSDDGSIWLVLWGDDHAIKSLQLTIPFCVDPYRFSLGSYSDMETAKKTLTSCLDGAFPAYDGRENREWVDRFINSLMNKPLRNAFKNNEVESDRGCVLFQKQEPFIRKVTKQAEATLKCDLFGHKFTLEITPPRTKR